MPTATQVVKNKPVATVGTLGTIVAALIGYAVYRGWIGADVGALLEPVVLVIAAAVVHALVSPYQKVKDVIERGLNITDADFGRIEAVLEQYGLQLVNKELHTPAETPAPAPVAPPAPPAP